MKNRLFKIIASLTLALMLLVSLPMKAMAVDYPILQPGAGYPIEGYKFATTSYRKSAESWVYTTSQQNLQGNGKRIPGYCFASFKWDQTGQMMRLISIEEYMALYRAEYIQAHVQIRDKVQEEIDLEKFVQLS